MGLEGTNRGTLRVACSFYQHTDARALHVAAWEYTMRRGWVYAARYII